MTKHESCAFAGFLYRHETELCQSGKCMKCNDGKWEETGKRCPC
jgi:hypothetical protein